MLEIKKLSYIFLLACCFGPSFLFMKVCVEEIPPLTLVSLRVTLGALALFSLLKLQGKSLWFYRSYLKHFVVMALSGCVVPFFLISYSERTISSALAGLINGSVPIFTATFAHFFIPNDQLNLRKMLGIFWGMLGLALIFVPNLKNNLIQAEGIMMVTIASIGYAIGMVYSKKYLQGLPPLIAPTWQLILASLIATPLCLIIERPYTLPFPSYQAILSVLGLALIGSALAFILYYKIIEIAEASYLSLSTFFFPLIALALGTFFLGEVLSWNSYLGGALILLGLVFAMKRVKRENVYELTRNSG